LKLLKKINKSEKNKQTLKYNLS